MKHINKVHLSTKVKYNVVKVSYVLCKEFYSIQLSHK